MDNKKILKFAKKVIKTEINAIQYLLDNLSEEFVEVVKVLYNCEGRVVLFGVGKSGVIAKKISATMASTGTKSFYIDATDAYHGDLGRISKKDIIILISNSGETNELLRLYPFFKNNGNVTIAITGNQNSTLRKNSDYFLSIKVPKEACPYQIVPTSSTTATLVLGDALAITLMELRGFTVKDFALFHPGGSLGKKLLTPVSAVMHKTDLPMVSINADINKIISVINSKKFGLAVIVDDENKILGIITDGDIRRALINNKFQFDKLKASDFMKKRKPICVEDKVSLYDAQEIFSKHKITSLLVNDKNNKLLGIIQIYDIEM